jgi:hypothetical protein
VAVSASIPPPPSLFPPNVWALWAQTYKLKCMDNMIFLIIIIMYCFYMSTQVVESLGPSGPNQKIYGCLKKISDTSDITS